MKKKLTKKQRVRKLINDSNYPSRLGQELIGAWTLGTGWVDEGSGAYSTDGSDDALFQDVAISDTKKYFITFKVKLTSKVAGLYVSVGGTVLPNVVSSGLYTGEFKSSFSTTVIFDVVSTNDFIGSISQIHLREVL